MTNTILFFFKPRQFFRKIVNGELRLYLSLVLLIYSAIYILSESLTGYLSTTVSHPLFYVDKKIFAILISLFSEFVVSFCIALIIYLLLRIMKFSSKFIAILLCVLSLKIISVFVIQPALVFSFFFKKNAFAQIWQAFELVVQMVYLFIALKSGFKTSVLKALLAQLGSLVIIVAIAFAIFAIKNDVSEANLVSKGLQDMRLLQFNKAIKRFETVVEHEPSNAMYQYYLGEAYRQYVFFSRYKALTPDYEESLLEKAEEAYKKSIELNPGLMETRMGLGLLYFFRRGYNEALNQFMAVIQLEPNNKEAHRKIGEVYLRLNKPKIAKKYFNSVSAGRYKPETPEIGFRLNNNEDIELLDNKNVNIVSQITWHIIVPTLYESYIGNIEKAETRINDIYSAILINVLKMKTSDDVSTSLNKEIKHQIIERINNSPLKMRFGIEILGLEIREGKKDGKGERG